jgi:hypothetical protein
MSTSPKVIHTPRHEHSVPWFWPMAAAIELGEEGLALFQDNLRYVEKAIEFAAPPEPEWATSNRIVLDLDTLRLRDFLPPARLQPRPRCWWMRPMPATARPSPTTRSVRA